MQNAAMTRRLANMVITATIARATISSSSSSVWWMLVVWCDKNCQFLVIFGQAS